MEIIGLNDYTDTKNWELVIRKVDTLVWGFYRDLDHKGTISDSQFDIGHKDEELVDLIDWLKEKFNLYYVEIK